MIDKLIEADRKTKKRIAVVGDSMIDEYIHGTLTACQDHCPKFVEKRRLTTPGGAAGAVRQLSRWNAEAFLLGPAWTDAGEAWNQVNVVRYGFHTRRAPIKTRSIDENGRIVWRGDLDNGYGVDAEGQAGFRKAILLSLRMYPFDALLISDYDKGFLDPDTIRKVIEIGNEQGIPVVSDAKREPETYAGSIVKCNDAYLARSFRERGGIKYPIVVTKGANGVFIAHKKSTDWIKAKTPVECRNHVGAGDCFASHLVLGLAHGLNLENAATIAHSAGRVYVQHSHGRPPWPHEIKKDLDPVGGKILDGNLAGALRRSVPGRIVFTNGCFRIPHAGHAWLMSWAKQQGDVLVVGLNTDESLQRLRPDEPYLPLEERVQIFSTFSPVDWIIPFGETDPCDIIRVLKPDLLVKGADYQGQDVPGHDLVPEVRFAPESPFAGHCSDLVTAIRGG